MPKKNELTESLEKYLLAIYEITEANKAARVKDVSNFLNVGGPAASDAVKTLAGRGFINYAPYGIITMTQKGSKKAKDKIRRHKVIANFLQKVLLVENEKISAGVKSIEYSMPEDIMEKFVQFLTFMENCSCEAPKWVKSYHFFARNGKMNQNCDVCMQNKKDDKKVFICTGCGWAEHPNSKILNDVQKPAGHQTVKGRIF